MYTFIKSMAIFWTFAEGLILITMRWGMLSLKRGQEKQPWFIFGCTILFSLLILLMFAGEDLFSSWFDFSSAVHLRFYRWALWNFFCTLWVILEGIIMVYVWRLYKIINLSAGKELKGHESADKGKTSRFLTGIPLLIVSFLAGYTFYQYNLFAMVEAKTIDVMGIYRISLFYIRICGLFWILFEWIVAIVGIRTYRLMKKAGEKSP